MHDPIYRRLFAFPRMVADLLRVVAHPDWIGEIDLGTLDALPAEYVGDRGQRRRGDAVWRVRFRDAWLYLLVLLEFQSRNDPRMALRNLEYTTLLYRQLGRRRELGAPGQWPPVLPLVLYNGDTPWTAAREMRDLIAPVPRTLTACQPAQRSLVLDERRVAVDDLPLGNLMRAVVGFEQSRSPAELAQVGRSLAEWLRTPGDTELGRTFADWMDQMARRMRPSDEPPILGTTLEEASMTLLDRVAQWPEQWHREGVAEGRREGVAEGRREGVAEGRREGMARERALLRRLAGLRFGASIADEVGMLLDATEDWDALAAFGELIVRAETGRELIDQALELTRSKD